MIIHTGAGRDYCFGNYRMGKRRLLFEFEDLGWFPPAIRDSMTDYLRHVFTMTRFYEPVVPVLAEALRESGAGRMVDLCSGGGGPIEEIQRKLSAGTGKEWRVVLTDRYPNTGAWQLLCDRTSGKITFWREPVDATAVPVHLEGFRTMFSGFHHLSESEAAAVLKNAVDGRQGIAIFDGADRSLLTMLGILVVHPLAFFLLTPFLKPFRVSRFLFTYLLPVIPACTVWDGLVSILRLHTGSTITRMTIIAGCSEYEWKTGKVKGRFGLNLAYLIGYPKINAATG